MDNAARLYFRLIGSRIRSQLQYRTSFAFGAAAAASVAVIDFMTIAVIFTLIPRFAGWSLPDVVFLFGTSYIPFKMADTVLGHVDELPQYIREGRFDSFLIRPLGALFQLVTSEFNLRWVGGLVQGGAALVYSLTTLSIPWHAGRVLMLVTMIAAGSVIFGSIWVATNTMAFWMPGGREAANAFTYGGGEFTMYPIHVFGRWMRRVLTMLVPLAFVNYYPALYVLGKQGEGPLVLRFLSPLVAVGSVLAARAIWRAGVRRYQSTGT